MNNIIPLPSQLAPKPMPPRDIDLPIPDQLDQVTRRAFQALREVLVVPITGQPGVMRQRIDAARLVLEFAKAIDPARFAPPTRNVGKARAKRLAALQAEIDELKLEAQRVQAESAVAALKKRTTPGPRT